MPSFWCDLLGCSCPSVPGPDAMKVRYGDFTGSPLFSQPGVIYRVHALSLSVRLAGADVTEHVWLAGVYEGESFRMLNVLTVPSVAGVYHAEISGLDAKTQNLAIAAAGGVPSEAQYVVYYRQEDIKK